VNEGVGCCEAASGADLRSCRTEMVVRERAPVPPAAGSREAIQRRRIGRYDVQGSLVW
jgi:hypothetical protein